MKIQIVYPKPGVEPSGGHRYNRALLEQAAKAGGELRGVPAVPGEPLHRLPLEPEIPVLWDSLLLAGLASDQPLNPSGRKGLLVHYLPFRDPLLAPDQRAAAERGFVRAAERMDFLVATGLGVGQWLRCRFPELPLVLAEPGVDPAFAALRRVGRSEPEETVRLATVANLLPPKGHKELLDVLATLRDFSWEWHLAGAETLDPVHSARFRAGVDAAGLRSRVRRHGSIPMPAVAALLAASDVFLFPSHYEAYGMALAEAAAAGLPIVTTAVGEARRLVRPGETGFVVASGDAAGWREAVALLLADADLRQRFRQAQSQRPVRTWDDTWTDFRRGLEALVLAPRVNGPGRAEESPLPGNSPG